MERDVFKFITQAVPKSDMKSFAFYVKKLKAANRVDLLFVLKNSKSFFNLDP